MKCWPRWWSRCAASSLRRGRSWDGLGVLLRRTGHIHGAPYANHYISVLTIVDRKITSWRDYLDPIAVFDATGWPDER
jgi:ketosteroid isomerase-like protein